MSILLQPAAAVLPAYRPVKWLVFFRTPDNTVFENALTTIFKNGVAIGPAIRFKSISNAPSPAATFVDYFFEIDIQKYCQDLLAPNTSLPSTFVKNTSPPIVNVDFFAEFHIEVLYEFIDPTTGQLDIFPQAADVSNGFTVFAISRKAQERMDLLDFNASIPPFLLQYLTKSARTLDICVSDNAFVSIIQNLVPTNGFKVEFFDSAGSLLDFGVAVTNTSNVFEEFTINTGLTALGNITYIDGSPTLPNPAIASYKITVGNIVIVTIPSPAVLYFPASEEIEYKVVADCCERIRLRFHWVNLLGGVDSYTFNFEKDLVLTTTSDTGEKALPWAIGSPTPNDVTEVGKIKLKSEGSNSYLLNSEILTNSEALWLSELLTSPKVFIELEGDLIPVTVQDKTQSITRRLGKIRYSIVATLANDLIIQRT